MLTCPDNSQVSLLLSSIYSFLLSFHIQRCVATVFASMGASVGKDPPSSVIVPQGSAAPAVSTVSTDILVAFHIQILLFSSLSFMLVLLPILCCCVSYICYMFSEFSNKATCRVKEPILSSHWTEVGG